MINNPEYKLTKFLHSLIKPYMPDSFILNSTSQILEKLSDFKFAVIILWSAMT